ncbi:class I SAM-dependent methyltransferase [Paraburkholderia sabiae]|uniref:Class I SAM-dependent methyltransferase n=1 Tax=Paraburkholderia sabiae TaxID=273251 RepID=A0ABU9QAR6_9BURK|nr:class I SAM-dependent methyltransferase [Paraburkholderia sabiae]WJZ72499.1 class I SAM-dependent methyltransferase [Paraburkholderia sabiae]CAD6536228.1 putative methyltransferase [Paraburkholderia sabiae]
MTHDTPHVHHAASEGYTKGADTYAKGRPDYPPELAAWLKDELALGPGKIAVDLGAGTGKFTPRLVETGAQVIAVEPVAQMREKLAAALPQVDVREGTAQRLPLDDAAVDAVLCAQSFHWFASRESLAEIRRVLKPGGHLGLVWNVRDARVPWVAQLDAIVNAREGDAPRYHTGEWRNAFPADGFSALEERHMPHGHTGSAEDVIVTRVHSTSFILALPPEQWAEIERDVRALIASEPSLASCDVVTVPYVTYAFRATRID